MNKNKAGSEFQIIEKQKGLAKTKTRQGNAMHKISIQNKHGSGLAGIPHEL